MRPVDKLNKEEYTADKLYDLLIPVFEDGKAIIDWGVIDETDDEVLLVGDWDDVAAIHAAINGWEGGDIVIITSPCRLDADIDRVSAEVEEWKVKNPNCSYTSRQERELNKLLNYKKFQDWLSENNYTEVCVEDFGVEVVFSDEYNTCAESCNGCRNIVRISPDSYCWTAPVEIRGEGYLCSTCTKEHIEDILEDYANVNRGLPEVITEQEVGLVKINEDCYSNGFHKGQDDSPDPIIKALNNENIDVWFRVHPSQFYVDFDVLVKKEEAERATEILQVTNTYQGYSTSDRLQLALKSASISSRK